MFKISAEAISGTKQPGFMPIDGTDNFMVDTAGASDTNTEDEYPNQTSIHTVLKRSKSFKIVLALSFSDISAERGSNLL